MFYLKRHTWLKQRFLLPIESRRKLLDKLQGYQSLPSFRQLSRLQESSTASCTKFTEADKHMIMSSSMSKELVSVTFGDGITHRFHWRWLRDQCKCQNCSTQSGQKIIENRELANALNCKTTNANSLSIDWEGHNGSSLYEGKWLRGFGYSDYERQSASRGALCCYNGEKYRSVTSLSFASIANGSDEGVHELLKTLMNNHACIVTECPIKEGIAKKVANFIGPTSHRMYGETFDVISQFDPINIAYTPLKLELHMDLAYYESPPGLQFLHCISFDSLIKGGESLLVDSHAVAEVFKEREPELFQVLATVPATFQKNHVDRENPVKMFYQRPHIATNILNEVVGVFWSPPFEGPLRVPENVVMEYYRAYSKFHSLVNSEEMLEAYGHKFRLKPGDMLIFNNRRMLHGRTSFEVNGHQRHLQGCYLDVDTVLSTYRVLSSKFSQGITPEVLSGSEEPRFGTSSHR